MTGNSLYGATAGMLIIPVVAAVVVALSLTFQSHAHGVLFVLWLAVMGLLSLCKALYLQYESWITYLESSDWEESSPSPDLAETTDEEE